MATTNPNDRRHLPHPHIAAHFQRVMERYGISPARLRRCAWRGYRIPKRRVEQVVLHGIPSYVIRWNPVAIDDWERIIMTAWQY